MAETSNVPVPMLPSVTRFKVLDWSQLTSLQKATANRLLRRVYFENYPLDSHYWRLVLVRQGRNGKLRIIRLLEYGNTQEKSKILLDAVASHPVYGPQAALELRRPSWVELLLHLREDLSPAQRSVSETFRKDGRRLLKYLKVHCGIEVRPALPKKIMGQPYQRNHRFDLDSLVLSMKPEPVWRKAR